MAKALAAVAILMSVATGHVSAKDNTDGTDTTMVENPQGGEVATPDAYLEPTPVPEPEPHGYQARVRLTYYTLSGRTASGEGVYMGATACSWNYRIGQRFMFSDGEVVRCNDRGLLGSSGWLDIWNQPWLANKYGPYTTVTVLDE